MSQVPTTAGLIEATDLGRTLGHEHLMGTSEAMRHQWPHLYDSQEDVAQSVVEVRRAAAYGVETICDPSCLGIGRDAAVNIAVTQATGVRFVMATGAYGVGFRFLPTFPPDLLRLADLFVHDLEVGIQGTQVRAGFIKVACDKPGLTAHIELAHRAAAQASLRTGAPIMAHSNPTAETGLAQMRVFLEEGVAPEKVQIAHTGDTDELEYIERLLATGCYIGMDRYGIERGLPTPARNATIVELVRRGHANRMTLGQDSCVRVDGAPRDARLEAAPNSHLTYLFEQVIPDLEDRGVAAAQLEGMIGANVHAWLSA